MIGPTKRQTTTTNWRHREDYNLPLPVSTARTTTTNLVVRKANAFLRQKSFTLALAITIVILLVQLFIAHHYLGSHSKRHALIKRRDSGEESFLLDSPSWFCHSYLHLNKLAELALKHQVDLIIVDEDLLGILSDGETDRLMSRTSNSDRLSQAEDIQFSSKTKQEASHKTIIHLAAINETSGGQPNLIAFHDDLKNYYHLLRYDDSSETMAPEVYTRQTHQLDDVHSDALRDFSGGRGLDERQSELMRQQLGGDYEISKIYTEFIAHLFILNTTLTMSSNAKANKMCGDDLDEPSAGKNPIRGRSPFVVIHLFVLYNYEYRPQEEWIQSHLALDEIERHKLLAYGVHSIDFRVPLGHSYIHTKRETSALIDAHGLAGYRLAVERPINQMRVFDPPARLLTFANNTYLHCKPSQFNISGLLDGRRKLNDYMKSLDASRLPASKRQRAVLSEQISIALQFMDVFSKTYGKFSFWLTGSSLLSYHKFCQLTAISSDNQDGSEDSLYSDQIIYDEFEDESSQPRRPKSSKKMMLNLELGLYASEISSTMLNDLSGAKMIGVTMISNWRKHSSSRVEFHVQDCPDILFTLHFYELRRDFYQHFYVTNANMIQNHKFRRKKSVPNASLDKTLKLSSFTEAGRHVFTTSNLELCWTRLDNIHPFRVPCDVHDHLRRIYIV